MDTVKADQVAYRKKIGKLGDNDVWELALKGGLHMVVASAKNGKTNTLGTGPHRAVARFIAKKNHSDLNLTELSKSDYVRPEDIQTILPKYEALTQQLRDREQGQG